MSIEVTLLISIISISFALYSGLTNLKRNKSQDDKQEAAEITKVIIRLEDIGKGITEIKSDIKMIKAEAKENRERLIKVEESAKQAHKRLDQLINPVK